MTAFGHYGKLYITAISDRAGARVVPKVKVIQANLVEGVGEKPDRRKKFDTGGETPPPLTTGAEQIISFDPRLRGSSAQGAIGYAFQGVTQPRTKPS